MPSVRYDGPNINILFFNFFISYYFFCNIDTTFILGGVTDCCCAGNSYNYWAGKICFVAVLVNWARPRVGCLAGFELGAAIQQPSEPLSYVVHC